MRTHAGLNEVCEHMLTSTKNASTCRAGAKCCFGFRVLANLGFRVGFREPGAPGGGAPRGAPGVGSGAGSQWAPRFSEPSPGRPRAPPAGVPEPMRGPPSRPMSTGARSACVPRGQRFPRFREKKRNFREIRNVATKRQDSCALPHDFRPNIPRRFFGPLVCGFAARAGSTVFLDFGQLRFAI